MSEQHWVRHAIDVGWFEFRRSVRAIRQDRARFALMVLGVAIPSIIITGLGIVFVDSIGSIRGTGIPDYVRGTIAYFWLFDVFIIAQRVASAKHRVEAEPVMLTTVSARTLVTGLILAEALRFLTFASLPIIAIGGLLAYGLTAPALLLSLPLAVVFFAVTAATAGSVIGYGIALLLETCPFVAKHKTALGVPIAIIGMGGLSLFYYPQVTGISQAALAWLPTAWFTDIAVLGGPLDGSLLQAGGALTASIIFVVAGGRVAEWETTAYWYSGGVTLTDDSDEPHSPATEAESQSLSAESVLAETVAPFRFGFLSRPTRRVAQMTVLRAWRDPQRLMFVLMPVVLFGSSFLSTGGISNLLSSLPGVSAVLLPWIAGAIFPLNPFGDEGSVLPTTLTAATGGEYVRGLIAPGVIFGLPMAVILTGIAGITSPYTISVSVSLVGLAIYLTIVSVALGPNIGMRFPRFRAISVGQADEVVPPRILAVSLHGVSVALPGGLLVLLIIQPDLAQTTVSVVLGVLPGFVLDLLVTAGAEPLAGVSTWFTAVGETIQAIPPTTFRATTGAGLLSGGAIVALAAYRDSIRRFNGFSPPQ